MAVVNGCPPGIASAAIGLMVRQPRSDLDRYVRWPNSWASSHERCRQLSVWKDLEQESNVLREHTARSLGSRSKPLMPSVKDFE